MFSISKLRDEHTELIAIVLKLTVICARSSPPPAPELADLRLQLQSKLFAHLQTEDWMLYPSLLDSADPTVVRTARKFSHEMGGLAASFVDYVQKWSVTSIADDWRGYCDDTVEISAALTARISRENEQLYPLLESLSRAA